MKITPARIAGLLAASDVDATVVLFFGTDDGLVRERADHLVHNVAGSAAMDPFACEEIPATALKSDPVRLSDAAATLSFTASRRVIRLRDATDAITPAVRQVVDHATASALIVVEAGALGKASSLRKLAEEHARAMAVGCYEDDDNALHALIVQHLRACGLAAEGTAVDHLVVSLGADRGITRSELDKLALYAAGRDRVTLDDAMAIGGDAAQISLAAIPAAACSGDFATLDRTLAAAFAEGFEPVSVLRATAQHLQKLLQAQALIRAGRTAQQATASLRPPVPFPLQEAFRQHLRRWPKTRLRQALSRVTQAEIACKQTGQPARLLCGRTLLQLAQAAGGA
jgi:DNA polymerase-3 subunit delta